MFSFLFAAGRTTAASGAAAASAASGAADALAAFPTEVSLDLPDGTLRTARLRRSARARKARMSLLPDGTLLLTVPAFLTLDAVLELLPHFAPGLAKILRRMPDAVRCPQLPQSIALPAAGKIFCVEIDADRAAGLRAAARCTTRPLSVSEGARRLLLLEDKDCLRLFGAVDHTALCARALTQWCRAQAALLLPPFVFSLAADLPEYGRLTAEVRVRDQRSRWGSCSYLRNAAAMPAGVDGRPGRIQLNWRALLLPVPLLTHLCLHELCHLRQMNHSPAFHAALETLSPQRRQLEKALTQAWRELPWWALAAS